MRSLFYAVVGMSYFESLLFERGSIIWASRNLPSVSLLRNSSIVLDLLIFWIVSWPKFRADDLFICALCCQYSDRIRSFHSLGTELVVSWIQHNDY